MFCVLQTFSLCSATVGKSARLLSVWKRAAKATIFFSPVCRPMMGVDDKPSLPKSHEASFGDEVLVTDNSVGRPTEEA